MTSEYSILLFFLIVGFSFLIWLSSRVKLKTMGLAKATLNLKLESRHFLYALGLSYFVATLAGYTIQNRVGNKYDMVILLPLFMAIAVGVKIVVSALISSPFLKKRLPLLLLKMSANLAAILFLFALIVPQNGILKLSLSTLREYRPQRHIDLWQQAENANSLKIETKIKNNTTTNDCITVVYGWGVGSGYYYSHRRSCSKYFLVNILPRHKFQEYAQEIITNSPAAIVYYTEDTDLNIEEFKTQIFNFPRVLEACYHQDVEFPQLFWANGTGGTQQECLKQGLPTQV